MVCPAQGLPAVGGDCQTLCVLAAGIDGPLIAPARRSVEEQQRIAAKPCGVVLVLKAAARIDRAVLIGIHHSGSVLPTDQILADSVSPVHVSPDHTVWIPLVIEMVDTVCKNKTVGIIVPAKFRRKMELRAEGIDILRPFAVAENTV